MFNTNINFLYNINAGKQPADKEAHTSETTDTTVGVLLPVSKG